MLVEIVGKLLTCSPEIYLKSLKSNSGPQGAPPAALLAFQGAPKAGPKLPNSCPRSLNGGTRPTESQFLEPKIIASEHPETSEPAHAGTFQKIKRQQEKPDEPTTKGLATWAKSLGN